MEELYADTVSYMLTHVIDVWIIVMYFFRLNAAEGSFSDGMWDAK